MAKGDQIQIAIYTLSANEITDPKLCRTPGLWEGGFFLLSGYIASAKEP